MILCFTFNTFDYSHHVRVIPRLIKTKKIIDCILNTKRRRQQKTYSKPREFFYNRNFIKSDFSNFGLLAIFRVLE